MQHGGTFNLLQRSRHIRKHGSLHCTQHVNPDGPLQLQSDAQVRSQTSLLQACIACCRVQFAEERLQCMLQLHPSTCRQGKADRHAKKRRRQVQVQQSSIGEPDQGSLLLQAEIQRLTADRAMLLTKLEVCFLALCCKVGLTSQLYSAAMLCTSCSL